MEDKPKERKRSAIIIVATAAAAALIVGAMASGGLVYALNRQKTADLEKQITSLKKQLTADDAADAAPSLKPSQKPAINEAAYEGWLTYDNTAVGYTLRYPPGWTFREESVELDGKPVEYVIFLSPGDEVYVTFGLKEKGADTLLTERTGVGAGEMKTAGDVTVANVKVARVEQVFEGKLKTVFYPGAGKSFTAGGFEGYAEFSALSPANYEEYNLKDAEETTLADKLVGSLQIKPKQ